jgi:S-adenosylmethionine synthetase
MVTLDELRRAAASSVSSAHVDHNSQCSQIIDVIYDKVLEMMNKDKKVGVAKRTFIVNSAKIGKAPIQKYISLMPNNDARDVIKRIELIIK